MIIYSTRVLTEMELAASVLLDVMMICTTFCFEFLALPFLTSARRTLATFVVRK